MMLAVLQGPTGVKDLNKNKTLAESRSGGVDLPSGQ